MRDRWAHHPRAFSSVVAVLWILLTVIALVWAGFLALIGIIGRAVDSLGECLSRDCPPLPVRDFGPLLAEFGVTCVVAAVGISLAVLLVVRPTPRASVISCGVAVVTGCLFGWVAVDQSVWTALGVVQRGGPNVIAIGGLGVSAVLAVLSALGRSMRTVQPPVLPSAGPAEASN